MLCINFVIKNVEIINFVTEPPTEISHAPDGKKRMLLLHPKTRQIVFPTDYF